DVTSDAANCGVCGMVCGANTPVCRMGQCAPNCRNFTGVKSIAGPAILYGFCWYLGSTGSSCDVVCADLGGINLANQAANSFPDNCNGPQPNDVSTYFFQNGNACSWTGKAGATGYHTLGYGHINNGYYGKCAAGMSLGNGAFPGDNVNLNT